MNEWIDHYPGSCIKFGDFRLEGGRYGYNSAVAVQPLSVGLGFRIYMTIPPFLGALLAIAALWFYLLHGQRLKEIKEKLIAGQ